MIPGRFCQHTTRVLFFACAIGVLLTGCKPKETAVERGNREQILEVGNLSEPTDLDPQIITSTQDFNIVFTLLEGLTTPDPKDLHPTPGAAESWDVSPDGTVYTFHLRPRARWSDGSPVTAHDFLYAYRRILSPALGSEYSYMLFPVRNAESFNTGKLTDFEQVGFKALDDLTLQVTLTYPTPYLPSLVAHHSWFPVQQKTIEKFGKTDQRGNRWTRPGNYVGNGPFVLKEWKANQIITVEKSPTYWDADHIRLHAINFYPIESADTEERAFRAGQLHVTSTLPTGKVESYRKEHPEVLHTDPWLAVYFYRFNVAKPPLNDPRVRRALAMSIDREAICKDILRAGQTPALQLVPPGVGYRPLDKIVEDVPAARKLLADAGYPDGKGFPATEVVFNTNEAHRSIAEALQGMWQKNLHVSVTLRNEEAKVLEQTMQQGDYQIARYAWTGDYLDPSTFMSLMISDGGNNQTGWASPEYDQLIRLAGRTGDPATREKIFQQAEGILVSEMPIMPIYFYTRVNLRHTNIEGWYSNLLDIHNPKGVFLRPEPKASPASSPAP